ncbi:MAG: glycosyl hydrolase [Candidatus Limiplasma sp.]|nr:glycosyl hydrolase [Candidatus Limiplasma sp.]
MDRDKLVLGEALSREKFTHPSREFGIMPFWFWNGEMSYEEMEYQLREYYAKGMPGLYIHARFGIRDYMPYLGEEWFDRVRFTIEKAQEIGLQVWVYDEYNWPSGTAGQSIQKDDPELTNVYLQLEQFDLPGQFFTFMEGTDSRYFNLEQSEPIYACAIKLEDMEKGNFEFVNLTPSLSFDKVITWEAPKGPWKLFYFIERKAGWYADVLNPETTRRFLEYTHERYKAVQGGSFSREAGTQGFYTDEPAMFYFELGKNNFTLPWSKKMFRIFRERNGYDLKAHLPKLFYNIGPDSEQVRHDFWRALSDQYDDTYYKQIRAWCDRNDVIFTGHLMHEESVRMHCKSGGNLFHHLRQMHMTGVDHLYPRVGARDMPNEHVALKIASSAAHQFGSARLICESMGGAYWDCTMERMKWIADWEYALGVNIFNPHGYHYSIEGERKRDWPPSQFYHHTWWPQYGLFNEYLSRIGYLMTGGYHVAKVAVLYPIHTMWANFRPQVTDKISQATEGDFVFFTDRLLRLHMDFDYLDEDTLAECEIQDGALTIRGERYEMLLLPPVTHIKGSTLEMMEKLVCAGGKVGGDALLPYKLVDGDSGDVSGRIQALFGQEPGALRDAFLSGETDALSLEAKDHPSGGKTVFFAGQGLWRQDAVALLDRGMRECITPEIEIDSDEVFSLHRVKDGRDFFFLINPTAEPRNITVSLLGEYAPELWNLEDGSMAVLPVYTVRDGKTRFQIALTAYGSAMVSVAEGPQAAHVQASDLHIQRVENGRVYGYGRLEKPGSILLSVQGEERALSVPAQAPLAELSFAQEWSFAIDKPNALVIQNWKFAMEDGTVRPEAISAPPQEWLDFRMGAWEMQLPFERETQDYPVDLWFAASFEARYLPGDLKLMIDGFKGESHTLYVNGRQVTQTPERSYLDAEIRTVPLAPYARLGDNLLLLRITARGKMDGLLDPLKLIGTFAVGGEGEGDQFIAPPLEAIRMGDWVSQGFPYYAGTGIYRQAMVLPPEYTGKKLVLEAELGADVLEVSVNGKPVGTRLWRPYRVDVSDALEAGENLIEIRVINTLSNLLEATRIPSGLFSARIIPYDRYEVLY